MLHKVVKNSDFLSHIHEFAISDDLLLHLKILVQQSENILRLTEPLFVGYNLLLSHDSKRI